MHEINHTIGARDHYHEVDVNGNCKFADVCSRPQCAAPNARPASCIMNEQYQNQNISSGSIICDACKVDIKNHLANHH